MSTRGRTSRPRRVRAKAHARPQAPEHQLGVHQGRACAAVQTASAGCQSNRGRVQGPQPPPQALPMLLAEEATALTWAARVRAAPLHCTLWAGGRGAWQPPLLLPVPAPRPRAMPEAARRHPQCCLEVVSRRCRRSSRWVVHTGASLHNQLHRNEAPKQATRACTSAPIPTSRFPLAPQTTSSLLPLLHPKQALQRKPSHAYFLSLPCPCSPLASLPPPPPGRPVAAAAAPSRRGLSASPQHDCELNARHGG